MKTKLITIAAIIASAAFSFAADATATKPAECAQVSQCASACNQKAEKEINTLADEEFAAKVFDRFSASVTFGYEGEYVFRGTHVCGASLTPEINMGYDMGAGFAAYAGVWGNAAIDGSDFNEIDVYTGVTYTYDFVTLDLGYLAYVYPNTDYGNENEIKIAASVDTTEWLGDFNVSPFAAYYYNFDLKAHIVEAGLTYTAPVTKWIADRNWGTVELGATYGRQSEEGLGAYNFVALSADAVVAVTDNFSISAGIRYAWRSNMEQVKDAYKGADRLWFGTSATFAF